MGGGRVCFCRWFIQHTLGTAQRKEEGIEEPDTRFNREASGPNTACRVILCGLPELKRRIRCLKIKSLRRAEVHVERQITFPQWMFTFMTLDSWLLTSGVEKYPQKSQRSPQSGKKKKKKMLQNEGTMSLKF